MGMIPDVVAENYGVEIVEKNVGMKAPEEALGREVSVVEQQASSVVVNDDASYAAAAEITKEVKRMQKKVTDYWEPLRVSTHQAYKNVTDKKKEMLDPLKSAEDILKEKMSAYADLKERQRLEQERLMRIAAEQEMKEKQAEIEQAVAEGNEVIAEYAKAEMEVMESVAKAGRIGSQTPKAEGVAVRKGWEIINIDSSKVPVHFSGVEIRPVDQKLVMSLIKASKGKIQIPGVQYREKSSISVKS